MLEIVLTKASEKTLVYVPTYYLQTNFLRILKTGNHLTKVSDVRLIHEPAFTMHFLLN